MYAIIFHAHQKLDRVAHRHLLDILDEDSFFPTIRQILKFEAEQGPDSVKLKQQTEIEQPWHFIDPHDENDTDLHDQIRRHYSALTKALAKQDDVRAAFEAAWLAHALVDGLTPAHHYPYEEELARLRGGEDRETRKGLIGRVYVKSDSIFESMQQSFKLVGPKGLLTTHAMFEAGAYAIIAPLRLNSAKPNEAELKAAIKDGPVITFKKFAKEVAALKLYERFYEKGWTQALSRDVRRELAPRMIKMITLAWYAAACEAKRDQK